MTRVLFWNINNFSSNKVDNQTSQLTTTQSMMRDNHIIRDVFNQNVPDIFVIVEVFNRRNDTLLSGVPVFGNARVGVTQLLTEIRSATVNDKWMVVPAITSGKYGYTEGVAVFYNSVNLHFLGPYVYGPDYMTVWGYTRPINRACPLANTVRPNNCPNTWLNGPQAYPDPWAGCLPNRAYALQNANMPNEDMLAGQWQFPVTGGVLSFPNHYNRSPFFTKFLDPNNNDRIINLYSVHTSPDSAMYGTRQVIKIPNIAPGGNEVTVIAGDFNVDCFAKNSLYAYRELLNANFVMGLDPRDGTGQINNERWPYCMTHLLPTADATPFGTANVAQPNAQMNVYPRFGYMGSSWPSVTMTGALDNIFVRYGQNTAGAMQNMTVVNSVVGSPYTALDGNTPAAALNVVGTLNYPAQISDGGIALPGGEDATSPDMDLFMEWFQQYGNFGVIRDTSDHLPLVIDV